MSRAPIKFYYIIARTSSHPQGRHQVELVPPEKARDRAGEVVGVSGERRWQAHKVAGIKTIPCVVKTYSTDGQFMVESLIENIHREDLTGQEKGKFAQRIMKEEGIKDEAELSKRLSVHKTTLSGWFDEIKVRKEFKSLGPKLNQLSSSTIWETKSLPKEDREQLLKKAIEEDFGSRKMRELVRQVKQEPTPEPIQLERTADDVVDDILSNLHDFKYHVDELLKSNVREKINIEDLSKSKADKAITTAGLHLKQFIYFLVCFVE